jgi:hypothetical protein
MPDKLRRRLTYANVTATLALFIALGGGAYAAVKLPKNSVTSVQVKNHTLLSKDFKKGQLKAGPRGLAGAAGAQGSPGATGPTGPAGTFTPTPDSLTGTDILESSLGTVPAAAQAPIQGYELVNQSDAVSSIDFRTQDAPCPAGKKVVGGGAQALSLSGVNMEVRDSRPLADGSGWTAFAYEEPTTANTWNWKVWAICANVAP